ncbi:DUF2267 domain-containing protein [Streptomyces sp. RB6PN25]|uniref:DUF2267 domain-containing protein n=1 Tax=Streptomyces humicola TaxID=2953240 RepID=A0ABT1Q1S8_9ACTN|nr:DUF2267 domain-containing protein [Streptomyces humicola]MCQ4083883.1 DUF2267 domain-containing protein [Streptomyces humicola]
MPTTGLPAFDHTIQTANTWLAEVEKTSGNADRHRAYRIMRAWLHTLRDRLPVDVAAKLGAQLPVLLRGVYYDGWDPSGVPVKYDRKAYVRRFAHESSLSESEVEGAARAVTTAMHHQLSKGELDEVFKALPHDVRELLSAEP